MNCLSWLQKEEQRVIISDKAQIHRLKPRENDDTKKKAGEETGLVQLKSPVRF